MQGVTGRVWAFRRIGSLLPLTMLAGLVAPATAEAPGAMTARGEYGRLPLSFEPNVGQFAPEVKFRSSGPGYSVALTNREAVVRLHAGAGGNAKADAVAIGVEGARTGARLAGAERLPGTVNYFLSRDRAQWRTGVPTYARVLVKGALPGVDVAYYGNQSELEFDVVLAAGADPGQVKLRVRGARSIGIAADGSLMLETNGGPVTLRAPVAYQETGGGRAAVQARFTKTGNDEIGFAVGRYDRGRTLTIDPVLEYATYLGGSYFDSISAVAADASGNAYVTGNADSCDFPTTGGAYDTSAPSGCFPNTKQAEGNLVFVAKINSAGTGLEYSTYIGNGAGTAIAVDGSGNAYVAGWTGTGFPVTAGAYQSVDNASANGGTNSFVAELNAAGSSLVYATYLGGSWGGDQINAIAVDGAGNAYVAGTATSEDFPTTAGAYQTTDGMPGAPFSFVTKVAAGGGTLGYSTYLMGQGTWSGNGSPLNKANGIAVDSAGDAYVVGTTSDEAFPVTAGAFQTSASNGSSQGFRETGYIAKLDPTGSQLMYASYLGGSTVTEANAVAVDGQGYAYVTGAAAGGLATTSGAFEGTAPGEDAFVAKVNPGGSALVYATYLGGSCSQSYLVGSGDAGLGIAVDGTGNAYVAGQACSTDFPVTEQAVEQQKLVTSPMAFDGFFSVVNATGSGLLYSTYLGGNGNLSPDGDWANGIALDGSGNAIVAGLTGSSNFPASAGAAQTTTASIGAGFVAKMTIPAGGDTLVTRDFTVGANPSALTLSAGQTGTATITVTPQTGFAEPVTLSCTTATGASCSFDKTQLATAGGAATATLTVTNTSVAETNVHPLGWVPYSWGAVMLCWFGFARRRRGELLTLLCAGFVGLGMLMGCGGVGQGPPKSGNGGGGGGSGGSGTSFVVTVTATAATAQHSTTVTVTVP